MIEHQSGPDDLGRSEPTGAAGYVQPPAFRAWLLSRYHRDGRAYLPISKEAGIGYRTFRGPVESENVAMAARSAVALARIWGDEPKDVLALLAGPDPLVTVPEVVARTGLGVSIIRAAIAAGELPAMKVGGDTLGYRIATSKLERFLAARAAAPARKANGLDHRVDERLRAVLEAGGPGGPYHDGCVWFYAAVLADGGSVASIAQRMDDTPKQTVGNVLAEPGRRLPEEAARAAARCFGADPDEVARLFGWGPRERRLPPIRLAPYRRRRVSVGAGAGESRGPADPPTRRAPRRYAATGDGAALRDWLRAQVAADDRPLPDQAVVLGVPLGTLRGCLSGAVRQPTSGTVLAFAAGFRVDPSWLLMLAGYAPPSTAVPQPGDFSGPEGLRNLLRALLVARRESAAALAGAAGLKTPQGLIKFLDGQSSRMNKTSLAKIAAVAGWDADEVFRLRPSYEGRGRAIAAKRRARGSWFRSEETRASYGAKRRASGAAKRVFEIRVERAGGGDAGKKAVLRHLRENASARRTGEWVRCALCGDPSPLVYRQRSDPEGVNHPKCGRALGRYSIALGAVNAALREADGMDDQRAAKSIREMALAERERIRARARTDVEVQRPRARGRPRGTTRTRIAGMSADEIVARYTRLSARHRERRLPGVTQYDFAAALGCSRETLSHYLRLRGLRWPPAN